MLKLSLYLFLLYSISCFYNLKMISSKISNIHECEIDNDGVFKYIQIKIDCNLTGESMIVVRGWKKFKYHKSNFDHFTSIESKNIKNCNSKAIGGGRININSTEKTISVYGYSKSYNRCDHSLTCDILKKYFPDYFISWNNEGY